MTAEYVTSGKNAPPVCHIAIPFIYMPDMNDNYHLGIGTAGHVTSYSNAHVNKKTPCRSTLQSGVVSESIPGKAL